MPGFIRLPTKSRPRSLLQQLEFAAKGLMTAYENIQASESRIVYADMAEYMVDFTKNAVLVQSGTAMLAQANMQTRTVLQLLGS